MKTFFKEAFEYTHHYNDLVIKSLMQKYDNLPKKSLQLINHTLNAQEIWNYRVLQKPVNTKVWDIRPLDKLKDINNYNLETSILIIDNYDFEKVIDYINSKGERFSNTVRDILFHVINHSTYHRGQIATDCKLNGMIPLVTDYIFYRRES